MKRVKPLWLRPVTSIGVGMLAAVVFGWVIYWQLFYGDTLPFNFDPGGGIPAWFVEGRRELWIETGLPFVLLTGLSVGVLVRHWFVHGAQDGLTLLRLMLPLLTATATAITNAFGVAISFLIPMVTFPGGLVFAVVLVFQRKIPDAAVVAALNLAVSFFAFFYSGQVFFFAGD